MRFTERIRSALTKAIKGYITWDDLFDDAVLSELAAEYVYEHDEDIKEVLHGKIDIYDMFEDALSDIDPDDIF